MKAEAQGLIDELPGADGFQCDVASDAEIAALFEQLKDPVRQARRAGACRRVYAPAEDLRGDFINTSSAKASASPTT